ncbi:hypothetical protein [Desulfovibrio sp.]|uniref:hypothetical protein n=1 Tax=Desulfovibrio sp. TaxID=885 RepID=UPI0025B9C620|nr:hypothetical protein [Desulfovibrio sp.]
MARGIHNVGGLNFCTGLAQSMGKIRRLKRECILCGSWGVGPKIQMWLAVALKLPPKFAAVNEPRGPEKSCLHQSAKPAEVVQLGRTLAEQFLVSHHKLNININYK